MKFKVMLDRKTNKKYISVGGQRIYTVKDVTCKEFLSDVKAALRKQVEMPKSRPKTPKPPKPLGLGGFTTNVNLNIPEGKQLAGVVPVVVPDRKEAKRQPSASPSSARPPSASPPSASPLSPLNSPTSFVELEPINLPAASNRSIADQAASIRDRARATADRVRGIIDSRKAERPKEAKRPKLQHEEPFVAPTDASYQQELQSEIEKAKLERERLEQQESELSAGRRRNPAAVESARVGAIYNRILKKYTKAQLAEKLPYAERGAVNVKESKKNYILDLVVAGNADILGEFGPLGLSKTQIVENLEAMLDIQTADGDTMSTLDIDNILDRYRPEFLGTFPRNEWPELRPGRNAIVMNFDRRGEDGSHWVGIIILSSGTVMYFDSFGRPMPVDMIESLKPHLEKLNPKTHFKLKENAVQLQNPVEKTCGWHVTKWIIDMIGRNKSFRESTGFDDSVKGEADVDKLQKKFDKYL